MRTFARTGALVGAVAALTLGSAGAALADPGNGSGSDQAAYCKTVADAYGLGGNFYGACVSAGWGGGSDAKAQYRSGALSSAVCKDFLVPADVYQTQGECVKALEESKRSTPGFPGYQG